MNEITDAMIDAHYVHCPGSPDYKSPPAVYTCKWCKEGITNGEEYVTIDGDYLHRPDCFWDWIEDQHLTDLVEKLGGTVGTAETPTPEWDGDDI